MGSLSVSTCLSWAAAKAPRMDTGLIRTRGRGPASAAQGAPAGGQERVDLRLGQRRLGAGLHADALPLTAHREEHLHLLAIVDVDGGDVEGGPVRRTGEPDGGVTLHVEALPHHVDPPADQTHLSEEGHLVRVLDPEAVRETHLRLDVRSPDPDVAGRVQGDPVATRCRPGPQSPRCRCSFPVCASSPGRRCGPARCPPGGPSAGGPFASHRAARSSPPRCGGVAR